MADEKDLNQAAGRAEKALAERLRMGSAGKTVFGEMPKENGDRAPASGDYCTHCGKHKDATYGQ